MLRRIFPAALLLGSAAALASLPTSARQFTQAESKEAYVDGITVTARGTATVSANRVTVQIRARGRAKTVKQALEEFRAKRTLLTKALADFDDVGVTTSSGGVRIGLKAPDPNSFIMDGEPSAPPFEAIEIVSASFPADDQALEIVADLLVAAADADCELNASSGANPYAFFAGQTNSEKDAHPVAFHVEPEALHAARELAMGNAFEDARGQASTLAEIAGRKLGRAESIRVSKPFPVVSPRSDSTERTIEIIVRFALNG